jgi:uncharacterized protein YwgA
LGKAELAWLIDFLGLTVKELVDPSSLEARLKVQKAVFLLKSLNVKPFSGYGFNLYIRGPYSPSLAADYYGLEGVSATPVDLSGLEKTVRWFVSHDADWLEVASSIMSIKERYPEAKPEETYSVLSLSKPWVPRDFFTRTYRSLRDKGLLR